MAPVALVGLMILITLSSQDPVLDWDRAEREVKRLPPSAFATILPASVVKELESRGCTVPQTFISAKPHNVVRGQFAKKGQFDWAVLCSRERSSSLLVFWGGPTRCPSKVVDGGRDLYALQGIGDDKIGYSWKIEVATKRVILHYTPKPGFSIDHEGIESRFLMKASSIRYCYGGQWLQFRGAD